MQNKTQKEKKTVNNEMKSADNRTSISELGLSVRTYNALHRAKHDYLEDLEGMTEKELFKIRNLGRTGVEEILQACREHSKSNNA